MILLCTQDMHVVGVWGGRRESESMLGKGVGEGWRGMAGRDSNALSPPAHASNRFEPRVNKKLRLK